MDIANIALTHAGKFHADDVFSAAFLKLCNPKIRVVRVTEVPQGFEGIVFDIGRGKFDHHQEGAEIRSNGAPYAAFGLLWREFGEAYLTEKGFPADRAAAAAAAFDVRFIQPLDWNDNTARPNQLADVIGAFNPAWDSDASADGCFAEAAAVAEKLLAKQFAEMLAEQRGEQLVSAALAQEQDGVVVLEHYAPWKAVLSPSDALFVVYPSKRGGFSAQGVPPEPDSAATKCPFPAAWAGKENTELQILSGLSSLRFCHKGRFLIAAGTREDAVAACLAAVKEAHAG